MLLHRISCFPKYQHRLEQDLFVVFVASFVVSKTKFKKKIQFRKVFFFGSFKMIHVTFYFMAFCYLFICCFILQLRRGNLCKCYFSSVRFKFQVRSKVGFYSTYISWCFTAHIFFASNFFCTIFYVHYFLSWSWEIFTNVSFIFSIEKAKFSGKNNPNARCLFGQ